MKTGVPRRTQRGQEFSEAVKAKIWERDKGICVYCRGKGYEIDHVIPRSKGGPAIQSNGVVTCSTCNDKKAAKMEFDWLFVGFFHLLDVGESLSWLDKLWDEKVRDVWERVQTLSDESETLLDVMSSPVMEVAKATCLYCGRYFEITIPLQRCCSSKCQYWWSKVKRPSWAFIARSQSGENLP